MAGRNKWSMVKHIQARVDAIKGRTFRRHALLNDEPDTLNIFTHFEVSDEILDQLAF